MNSPEQQQVGNQADEKPPKPTWKRRILRELPWLLAFAAVYFWISNGQAPGVSVGDIVAPVRAEVIGGGSLDSAQSGLPKVFVFWAPWCGVCGAEFPMIGDLQQDLEGKADVIGVGLSGSKGEMDEFVAEHKPDFKNVYGDSDIAARFGVRAFPTIIIVDGGHTVKERFVGITTPWRLRFAVNTLSD
jgi:thiol-disulfide isomerase/thioredoxin